MNTWTSGYLDANGINLHYTRTGGTKPPLLLAHGFSDDSLCWTPIAEALQAQHDVIMLDARGHGRSDDPLTGYAPADHAADIAGAIDALHLHKPTVMGHSMGAVSTLALAGLYPALPGAIILEDPPPFWMDADVLAAQVERRKGVGAGLIDTKRKTGDELLAACRANSPHWPEGEYAPWVDAKLRISFNVLAGFTQPIDIRPYVTQITCPALLLIADPAQGGLTTAAQAGELQRLAPSITLAHIPNAGHSIRRDRQAAYLTAVRVFLQTNSGRQ